MQGARGYRFCHHGRRYGYRQSAGGERTEAQAEEETITLREIEILEIATQEEKMYAVLEELAKQERTLLSTENKTEEP